MGCIYTDSKTVITFRAFKYERDFLKAHSYRIPLARRVLKQKLRCALIILENPENGVDHVAYRNVPFHFFRASYMGHHVFHPQGTRSFKLFPYQIHAFSPEILFPGSQVYEVRSVNVVIAYSSLGAVKKKGLKQALFKLRGLATPRGTGEHLKAFASKLLRPKRSVFNPAGY